jgi:hypothetical protein
LELHSGTTLPLLAAVYRNAGARLLRFNVRAWSKQPQSFSETYRPNKHDLEKFKIVIRSAINAVKR